MKRAIWFRASLIGDIPVHWSPITWQGWAVVAGFAALIILCSVNLRQNPALLVTLECTLIALLIGVAAATDNRAR